MPNISCFPDLMVAQETRRVNSGVPAVLLCVSLRLQDGDFVVNRGKGLLVCLGDFFEFVRGSFHQMPIEWSLE